MGANNMIVWIGIMAGFVLSLYALYVEHKANVVGDSYEALCDLSETISCSKVFLSDYGKVFSLLGVVSTNSVMDLPNAFYGLLFYFTYALVLLCWGSTGMGQLILLFLATCSLIMCAGLSYVLAVILRDKCLVCFMTYVCNFVLFVNAAIQSSS